MLRFRPVYAAVLLSCSLHAAVFPVDSYVSAVERDRAKSNIMMRGPEGPFALVARLHPKPGVSSLGRDPANDLVLPVEKAPAHVGKIDWQGERAVLRLEPGVTAVVDGKQVASIEVSTSPAHLKIGEMTLNLSFRDSKLLVSVSDADALKGKKVNPAAWFPVNPAYRITADWVPFAEPKTIRIPDTDGGSRTWKVPGYASFVIDGKKLTLQPVLFPDVKELDFFFRDRTAGHETYGAGRFLTTDLPKNGKVILDFNQAYNPSCAYNHLYSCPIPPEENHLSVRIPAGALKYVFAEQVQ